MTSKHKLILSALLVTSTPTYSAQAPWVGVDLQDQRCTGGGQGYGPYDYTKAEDQDKLPIVDSHHLSQDIEYHIKGTIPEDLDYTLRAIPNHHRALLSMIRYELKIKSKLLTHPLLSRPECYLQRAIHFSPNDAASLSLYAYYLKEIGQLNKAAEFYQTALAIDADNAKIAYSYSLLLIELKRYDEALQYAKIAYQHKGAPQGLRKKLETIGVWPK